MISSSPNELLKADNGKLGDSDSSVLRSSEEEMDDEGFLGRVPDSSWIVPHIPSPPTSIIKKILPLGWWPSLIYSHAYHKHVGSAD